MIANIAFNPRKGSVWEREEYFDEELYKRGTQIERGFSVLDGFKALLIRYQATTRSWVALPMMAFCVCLLRKIHKNQLS
ncbi:MAG: hypothetical protein H7Y04_08010 [Verrucomicrobia bacterium]|nr:hypothetical protein [Cytophagales bacterium]